MESVKERKPRAKAVKKTNITIQVVEIEADPEDNKKGRKPKGGKLVMRQPEVQTLNTPVTNIILHLKCTMKELAEYMNKKEKMSATV